jgi:hypothetical protein
MYIRYTLKLPFKDLNTKLGKIINGGKMELSYFYRMHPVVCLYCKD